MNKIKNIKVLGTNCSVCEQLFETVKKVVVDIKLEVEVEYINDIQKIIDLGVFSSPVLIVNDEVILVGKVPKFDKLKEMITTINNYE